MQHTTYYRNRDFINQFRKSCTILRRRGLNPSVREIVVHALSQRAPSYYVDFYRASEILKRGRPFTKAKNHRSVIERQWADMTADFERLKKKRPEASPSEIILDLCVGRAGNPRFYLSERRALTIVSHFA